jgi:hypothetical protein
MKRSFALLLFLFLLSKQCGAVPESGIWKSGGAANYSLLLPADSITLLNIHLQQQKIFIQLYPGFAVVKGTYWLRNSSNDTIMLSAGYPHKAEFSTGTPRFGIQQVYFDDQYSLRVLQDGKVCEVLQNDDWRTWENVFPPQASIKIETYLIVETNSSALRNGWSESDDNVFVYLFQSPWKPIIEKGEIFIQLMDEISIDDVHGISPDSLFMLNADKNILRYTFSDLDPVKAEFNIAISYGKSLGSFYFNKIAEQQESYFQSIDQSEKIDYTSLEFRNYKAGNPLDFGSAADDPVLQFFLLIAIIVAGTILLILKLAGIFKSKKTT